MSVWIAVKPMLFHFGLISPFCSFFLRFWATTVYHHHSVYNDKINFRIYIKRGSKTHRVWPQNFRCCPRKTTPSIHTYCTTNNSIWINCSWKFHLILQRFERLSWYKRREGKLFWLILFQFEFFVDFGSWRFSRCVSLKKVRNGTSLNAEFQISS